MKSLSLVFILSLCFCSALIAQNSYSIKGIVADTASNYRLQNATISILHAKDSTLYKFTRAAENGTFSIPSMKKGDFILLLTYPSYADYVSNFKLTNDKPTVDFGLVNMFSKTKLLNEVLVKGKATAIRVKGDTTEFNAGSFTIQPNDKVEDLLKKLPGIQVDKDGKITAQGKTVPKVLVDGEEFFGDDPTLVTKNLRADMVDKVQFYEKSSDQAAFTGIDDGEKTPTINIKLKEDKKNGYFGKAEIGAGSDDFYQGQLMFNAFKAKKKFSVYGVAGNNGKTGLNRDDSNRLGTANENVEFVDGGGMISYSSGDDLQSWGGRYYGDGIPKAYNTGIHYDTKWNKDKESINANFKIGSLRVEGAKNILNQNNLPTGLINSNSDQATNNYIFRQNFDGIYQIAFDTTSNLRITVRAALKNNETHNDYNTISNRVNNTLVNTSARSLNNNGKDKNLDASAFYTKKLKKKGRTFSLNVSQSLADGDIDGFLNSKNNFYNTSGILDRTEIIDQFKTTNTSSSIFSTKATYTEPFSDAFSLILNYGFGMNNNKADKRSFNASVPGRYDVLDTVYSNNFEVDQFSNQGGASFSYKTKKATMNWGTQISNVNYKQLDLYTNTNYKQSFLNWMPQASYQYRFSAQKSLRLNYNGRTAQPSVSQLQPIKNNNDPLNIPIGNPNLKPSYSNRFGISYNSYKVLSGQGIYLSGEFGFTSNAIVSNTVTDPINGSTVYQSINLTNKKPVNYNVWIDLGKELKALETNISLGLSTYGDESYNYVNNVLSTNKNNSFYFNLNINKSKEKKYEFYTYFGPSYTIQKSSLQTTNSNGWGFNANGSFRIYLPGKIEISSDLNYEQAAKTQSFDSNFSKTVLNSTISKKFLKSEGLKMSITGNDLFNQNVGFSRSSNDNMFTQTSAVTIKRYFMYSISWDFNKMGSIKK